MRRVCIAAMIVTFILACSGSETVEPVNQSPSIEFTFNNIAVWKNLTHDLTVAVSDPDGDPLTVSWTITSGTLTPQNTENTIVTWDPPDTPGADTVTVSVSDGQLSSSVTEIIKRGTLVTLGVGTSSRTFTKAESPYIIRAAVVTPSIGVGSTFTLEAGVEWYIHHDDDEGTPDLETIAVEGAIVTHGTESEPVVIVPNDRAAALCGDCLGWWGGFDLVPDGTATMDYTQIKCGVYDLRMSQGDGTATLRNCSFQCSSGAGIKLESNGTLVVDSCRITDNGNHGIDISSLVSLPASVSITNSEIRFNGHTGIYMDLYDVGQDVPINISRNLIEFNAGNGIAITHAVWPTIHNNDISKNNTGTLSNIRLLVPFPDASVIAPAAWDSLLATNNYWGGTFQSGEDAFIEQGIWDSKDIPSLGTRVIINPWKNESQHGQQ